MEIRRLSKAINYKNSGFAALISILIVAAVALGVSMSISLLGVDEMKSSYDYKNGRIVYQIASGCLEEALLLLRNDPNYLGGSMSLDLGSCTIALVNNGNYSTINIRAEISGPPTYIKNLQAETLRTGNSINLISLSEVE